jgi:hypothetical protein
LIVRESESVAQEGEMALTEVQIVTLQQLVGTLGHPDAEGWSASYHYHGVTLKALARRGLVEWKPTPLDNPYTIRRVRITDAGRAALGA